LLVQAFDTAFDQLPSQLVALDTLFTVGAFDQPGFQAQGWLSLRSLDNRR
jgi:hypothetical protein